jgi:hypothetical protein
LGNPPIYLFHQDHYHHHQQGIVTRLHRHHFQALPSSTTLPYSSWYQAQNQAQWQHKNIRSMGDRGKDTISPKEVVVDIKCSHLSNSHQRGRHLQEHLECLQNHPETIPSFGSPLPP